MKKVISLILSFILIFTMAVPAFAAGKGLKEIVAKYKG
jgi:hypothetical protein